MKPIVMGLLVVGMVGMVALPAQAQNNFPYNLNFTWGFNPLTAFACTPAVDMPDASVSCALLTPHRAAPTIPFNNASVLWHVVGGINRNPAYPGVGGVRYGISWDASIGLGAGTTLWNLCTGGLQVPSPTWPASGSYNSITWPGGCYNPGNADGVTKIGFFTFLASSTGGGQFRMEEDPSVLPPLGGAGGAAVAASCPPVTEVRICAQLLGKASIGATDMSLNTCTFTCAVPNSEQTWGQLKNIYR